MKGSYLGQAWLRISWLFLRVRSIKLKKSGSIFHLSSGRWYLATLVDLWGSQTKFPSPTLRLVCHQVSQGSIHETLVKETQKFLKLKARVKTFWWTERLMTTRSQVMMTQKRLLLTMTQFSTSHGKAIWSRLAFWGYLCFLHTCQTS